MSLVKMSMQTRDHVKYLPNIGDQYTLIYLKGSRLSEHMGNEATGEYYIADSNGIVGCEKTDMFKNPSVRTYISQQYFDSLNKIENIHKIVIIGKFRVDKINLWGPSNSYFCPSGKPLIEEPIYKDDNIDKWQSILDSDP